MSRVGALGTLRLEGCLLVILVAFCVALVKYFLICMYHISTRNSCMEFKQTGFLNCHAYVQVIVSQPQHCWCLEPDHFFAAEAILHILFYFIFLFIWLHQVFSCGMRDLVSWPEIKPRLPALGPPGKSLGMRVLLLTADLESKKVKTESLLWW